MQYKTKNYLVTVSPHHVIVSGSPWPTARCVLIRSNVDPGFLSMGDGGRLTTYRPTPARLDRIKRLIARLMPNPNPPGTTHTFGGVHFKVVGKSKDGTPVACKWIESEQAWANPKEYRGKVTTWATA